MEEAGKIQNWKTLFTSNALSVGEGYWKRGRVADLKVEEDGYGFNIYRGVDGEFKGRCFYINCENSSQSLYETIKNIVQKENAIDAN